MKTITQTMGRDSGADRMTIYTDGAANLYAAGSALIVYDGCNMVQERPYTLHPTTAFFAEMFAVKKAAEYLQTGALPEKRDHLHRRSQGPTNSRGPLVHFRVDPSDVPAPYWKQGHDTRYPFAGFQPTRDTKVTS